MQHIVLIDGHHLMYRAYFAIPRTMRTQEGEQVNAVFGVASMMLQILKTEAPDGLLFCFDEGDKTFRHEEYEGYKAGRADTPEEFYDQIPVIFDLIDAFGIVRVSNPGYEADDLLCAYAREAEKRGDRVTIVTGDRDTFQLASPSVRIAIPSKGYQMPEYLDDAKVLEKYGVTPAQIPDYKGLVGDASDNLKGVPGIGPKAASSLLQSFGSVENVYEHLADVKPAWREKLEQGRESAFFCKRMAELVCDFPLPVPFADITLGQKDLDTAVAFFRSKNFNLLTKRLASFLETDYAKAHFTARDLPSASSGNASKHNGSESPSAQLSLL